MSKHYETVFILTPVLSDDQAKEAAKKFKKSLSDGGAKIVNEENWGLKKLAYPIQKKSTGFYHLLEYTVDESNITAVADLELIFKRDERILRFLTVSLDKHAIAYSEKRRTKLKGGETSDKRTKKEKADA
ncbi:MAG: 30S ribosomal protein S6 [Bacteroidota bacterium]|nr:30S ribosomal protein S6 [Bacteroidota bacterium]